MQRGKYATVDYPLRIGMTISTNRESDRFMLRLPDGMRDKLKEQAAINSRSMNSEIIARLERSFGFPDPGVLDSYKAMALQQRVIIELADAAGIKISNKLRADIEQMISEAAGDIL